MLNQTFNISVNLRILSLFFPTNFALTTAFTANDIIVFTCFAAGFNSLTISFAVSVVFVNKEFGSADYKVNNVFTYIYIKC